jgi:hypothetical protein
MIFIVSARRSLLTLTLELIVSPNKDENNMGFPTSFSYRRGVGMAVAYAVSFRDVTGSAISKGLIAAVFIWVVNACFVMPLIGQGLAEYRVLTWLGMLT